MFDSKQQLLNHECDEYDRVALACDEQHEH
jgi:hypothetical protein